MHPPRYTAPNHQNPGHQHRLLRGIRPLGLLSVRARRHLLGRGGRGRGSDGLDLAELGLAGTVGVGEARADEEDEVDDGQDPAAHPIITR